LTEPIPVAVLSTSRADGGPLGPVLAGLDADPRFLLLAMVWRIGGVVDDAAEVPRLPDLGSRVVRRVTSADARGAELGVVGADLASWVSQVLDEHRPRAMLVLGDRWELPFAILPGLLQDVCIVHLHGGELSAGAIDDRIRHAITKLADLHLCATEEAAARIRGLGEPRQRIVVTGAPGLDRFTGLVPAADQELAALFQRQVRRPFGLVTYHPPTAVRQDHGLAAADVFAACARELADVLVTHPGADPGSAPILAAADAAVAAYPQLCLVPSLGQRYPAVLASADVVVGNSSSGIIEAASFGVPVVDVGTRQSGRLAGPNVLHVDEGMDSTAAGIRIALDPAWRRGWANMVNPYGDGRAVPRILDALAEHLPLGVGPKRFVDEAHR